MSERISTLDCTHRDRLFLCGGHGVGEGHSYRYGVSVCRDCGQFHVFKEENGHFLTVEFTLNSQEALAAAGQHVRYLMREEGESEVGDVDAFVAAAEAVAVLNLERSDSIRPRTVGAVEAFHTLEDAWLKRHGKSLADYPMPQE